MTPCRGPPRFHDLPPLHSLPIEGALDDAGALAEPCFASAGWDSRRLDPDPDPFPAGRWGGRAVESQIRYLPRAEECEAQSRPGEMVPLRRNLSHFFPTLNRREVPNLSAAAAISPIGCTGGRKITPSPFKCKGDWRKQFWGRCGRLKGTSHPQAGSEVAESHGRGAAGRLVGPAGVRELRPWLCVDCGRRHPQ